MPTDMAEPGCATPHVPPPVVLKPAMASRRRSAAVPGRRLLEDAAVLLPVSVPLMHAWTPAALAASKAVNC